MGDKVHIEFSQAEALVLLRFLEEVQGRKRYSRRADYGIADMVIDHVETTMPLLESGRLRLTEIR